MSEPLESLEQAREELKRADHQIYVSLKYTRTVDVLKNIILRLIASFDQGIEALLTFAKSQKKLTEIPIQPVARMELLKEVYEPDPHHNWMEFYELLRQISKADFERSQEYRRHVTMTAHLNGKSIEITIDIINDYFEATKDFIKHAENLVKGTE